ncbi:MAG: DUF5050 domain-containing protein [Lachnospiraceae bacterium]|nr:DUF5050 domain-containing protein [Lachnospiraceae bacterium]MDE7239513.1 DUF5050 domain-containing protein [Lachnospiraceae bacterium]
MATRQKYLRIRILLAAFLIVCIAACGKQTDIDCETEPAYGNEDVEGAETENEIKEDATENAAGEEAADTVEDTTAEDEPEAIPSEPEDVITVYVSEDIAYSDEVVPVQYVDDLSLLEELKYTNSTYVYQDGNVYYRRYHEDSYEEAALWAMYNSHPIPGTKKEIVCIDSDGKETELFTDEGYGEIYLVNDRFYMTDGVNMEVYMGLQLYSVDMQGNNRIDYGNGRILAIDRERNVMVLQMWEEEGGSHWDRTRYYAMNYETGETELINFDDSRIRVEAYQDGWLYYTKYDKDDKAVHMLCAVSLEGEQREILALTSDHNINNEDHEYISHVKVDEDRIYFLYGGYSGTLVVFQGGLLISVRLDGTDYRAVMIPEDFFYLSHNNGKTMIYFPRYFFPDEAETFQEHNMWAWDMDANTCYFTDFPERILRDYDLQTRRMPTEKGVLCEWSLYGEEPQTNIYAVPDDSGSIVRVATDLGDCITKWEDEGSDWIRYRDLYYADGFLYFTIEYSAHDETASIGWRDGYRRLRSEVYRLKTGESTANMLYSY